MIYFIRSGRYVKIGYTKHSMKRRLEDLQIGNPVRLEVIAMIDGDRKAERATHDRFIALHIQGEWFKLTDEIRAFIAANDGRPAEEVDRENRRKWAAQAVSRMAANTA
jgi:hypothetical protein